VIGRDGIAGLAVAAASLALFGLTLGLERNPLVPIGPEFYPRIVLGATAVLALAVAAADLLRKAPRTRAAPANYALVAVSFGVFALYVALLPLAGFRVATFLLAAALNLVLSPPRSAAHWGRALVFGALTAAATYYAFERYLDVLLPRGSLTGF
jgi:hypothetical protein